MCFVPYNLRAFIYSFIQKQIPRKWFKKKNKICWIKWCLKCKCMRSDKIYTWNEEKSIVQKFYFHCHYHHCEMVEWGAKKIIWREMKKIPKQSRKKCQHFWTTITPMCTSLLLMTMATITMTATIIINNSRIYFKRHLVKYIGDTHTHTHTTRECCHSLSRILMSPLDVYQNVYFYPIVFYSFLTISCILYRSRKF